MAAKRRQLLSICAGVFLLSACGGNNSDLLDRDLQADTPPSVERVRVRGKWVEPASLQVRDLGTTRLISYGGIAQFEVERWGGFESQLNLDLQDGVLFFPAPGACKPDQVAVQEVQSRPLQLRVTAWVWEATNERSACREVFEQARTKVALKYENLALRGEVSDLKLLELIVD